MTKDKYDPYEGFARIANAAENLNREAIEIVTLHLALEREIELALSKRLIRVDKLGLLSFVHKATVFHATWDVSQVKADQLFAALRAFNELRNAVAHGNSNNTASCRQNLFAIYRSIDRYAGEKLEYAEIAQGICAYMGDGMMPEEFRRFAEDLHELVHVELPRALGVKPRE